jgi:hypothetical protein
MEGVSLSTRSERRQVVESLQLVTNAKNFMNSDEGKKMGKFLCAKVILKLTI